MKLNRWIKKIWNRIGQWSSQSTAEEPSLLACFLKITQNAAGKRDNLCSPQIRWWQKLEGKVINCEISHFLEDKKAQRLFYTIKTFTNECTPLSMREPQGQLANRLMKNITSSAGEEVRGFFRKTLPQNSSEGESVNVEKAFAYNSMSWERMMNMLMISQQSNEYALMCILKDWIQTLFGMYGLCKMICSCIWP